jgi:hypothetical protein
MDFTPPSGTRDMAKKESDWVHYDGVLSVFLQLAVNNHPATFVKYN